jgi:hypothetical protein
MKRRCDESVAEVVPAWEEILREVRAVARRIQLRVWRALGCPEAPAAGEPAGRTPGNAGQDKGGTSRAGKQERVRRFVAQVMMDGHLCCGGTSSSLAARTATPCA